MSKKKKKKKKSVFQKITDKFSSDPEPDEMVVDTVTELKEVVSSMRDIFEEFEDGYSTQLEKERGPIEKIQSKLPGFLQSNSTKNQEKRIKRIKNNRKNLSDLEDNLSKLELILTSSSSSLDTLSKTYMETASVGREKDQAILELEARMDRMEQNIAESMSEMTAQISLIKSALDNMAGQLDEQGVKLEGIDGKIDVIDSKLDKAHEMLKKISKKITGNRLLMLALFGGTAAIIISNIVS